MLERLSRCIIYPTTALLFVEAMPALFPQVMKNIVSTISSDEEGNRRQQVDTVNRMAGDGSWIHGFMDTR